MKRYLLLLAVPCMVFAFGSGTIKRIDQIENNTGTDIVLKPNSDVKVDTFSGNFVLQSGSLKEIEESAVSNTELSYLSGATSSIQNQLNVKVPNIRQISTTNPLKIDGVNIHNLSVDRTISMPAATTSADGYLTSADWNTFNNKATTDTNAGTICAAGEYLDGDATCKVASTGTPSFTTVTKLATDTLATTGEDNVVVDATAADFTINLPTASGNNGLTYKISKSTDANLVTIDASGSETIDGDLTVVLYSLGDSIIIFSDGTNWKSGSRNIGPRTVYIKDVKPSTTNGGTFTSGAWQTRDLNTLEGDAEFVSLSSNQFTLDAGKYIIHGSSTAYEVNMHQLRVQNTSDATTEFIGVSSRSAAGGGTGTTVTVTGEIEITSSKTFELQHRCQTTKTTNGFGNNVGWGSEVYSQISITKVK